MTSNLNPFKYLINYEHDPYAEHGEYFILRPHQTIPKYYLFANRKLNKLLLHYSMGSGKSASAIFVFLHYLKHNMMRIFNNNFLYPGKNIIVKPNILVVASWMTWQQIDTELINHPEFGMVTYEQRAILDTLEHSTLESDKTKETLIKKEIKTRIHKYIRYTGYQAFFNMVFPEKNIAKYGQNIDSLVEEYKNNTLVPSRSFIKSLENTVIVVDEMQKLYSSFGLNTYGFAIAYIAKHAEEYKCKIIFLTGTMINSSIGEVPDILNILADDKKWIERDHFCEQEIILGDIPIWKFKKDAEDESIEYLKDRFLFYDQKVEGKGGKAEIVEMNKGIYFPDAADVKRCSDDMAKTMKYCAFLDTIHAIKYPKFDMLPREYHVGNRLISGLDENQAMVLYSVKVKGIQKEVYDNWLKNKANVASQNDDDSEMTISIHDAALPPSTKYSEHGIYKQDNIFKGSFLGLDSLWKYSAIGYEMCCLCLLNAFAGEKTVLYHNKLNSFGIKQYAAILNYNGFIKFGNNPNKDSICKSCRRPYGMHSLNLEERLKNRVCNEFQPLVYDYLTGDLDTSERMFIVNDVYNNPQNVNGKLISALFISDVAYAGVNLLATHNIVFLSKVSNISKWKQIYNRVVRINSHAIFPEDKKYAKIYTLVIEGTDENTNIGSGLKLVKDKDLSYEEKYYKKNIILNVDIVSYTQNLAKKSISDTLFNHPENITFDISRELRVMFAHDLDTEFDLIIKRSTPTYTASEWELDTYANRIKDKKYSLSFIDFSRFPPEFIKRLIQRSPRTTIFRYKADTQYVRIEQRRKILQYQAYNTINYSQLKLLENKKSTLQSLLKDLRQEVSITKKHIILYNICKLYAGKFEELADINLFWENIYDIGDEFYEDDEKNFFVNHSPKNRSSTKMAGFYYGNFIVRKNGAMDRVPIKYISINGIDKYPYIYRIVSVPDKGIVGENSPFYLHVKILKKMDKDLIDRRKQPSGVACFTMDISEVKSYFPKLKISTDNGYKRIFCKELMWQLCEEQAKEKERFVYSPYEHF